jgi:hypothetical protein
MELVAGCFVVKCGTRDAFWVILKSAFILLRSVARTSDRDVYLRWKTAARHPPPPPPYEIEI